MLSNDVVQKINKEFGRDVRYSSDAEELAVAIHAKTGERLSVNTIKRLLGMLDENRAPRLSTLDIIAKYLDFNTWGELCKTTTVCDSFFGGCDEVDARSLSEGDNVVFTYNPDRRVVCVCLAEKCQFRVTYSMNSKLCEDDIITVEHFIVNYPLLVTDVLRNGVSLGRYTAGKVYGLTSVKVF